MIASYKFALIDGTRYRVAMIDLTQTRRSVLVTGAANGVGLATAKAFAEAGYDLVLVDLDEPMLEAAANTLRHSGSQIATIAGSVAERETAERAARAAASLFGRLDVLVNNAGVTGNCNAAAIDEALLERVTKINQWAPLIFAQEVLDALTVTKGSIINLSSIYGLVAAPNRAAYSMSKAAIVMLTKVLAVEWAERGVRVNCVAPGYVETPGTMKLAEAGRIDLDALRRRTPQGRLASSEDIAGVILSLCQPSHAHVTGQILAVDGGWSAYGYL